jgi:hypothetical protein
MCGQGGFMIIYGQNGLVCTKDVHTCGENVFTTECCNSEHREGLVCLRIRQRSTVACNTSTDRRSRLPSSNRLLNIVFLCSSVVSLVPHDPLAVVFLAIRIRVVSLRAPFAGQFRVRYSK